MGPRLTDTQERPENSRRQTNLLVGHARRNIKHRGEDTCKWKEALNKTQGQHFQFQRTAAWWRIRKNAETRLVRLRNESVRKRKRYYEEGCLEMEKSHAQAELDLLLQRQQQEKQLHEIRRRMTKGRDEEEAEIDMNPFNQANQQCLTCLTSQKRARPCQPSEQFRMM
ncbi:hypothetical protein DPMN_122113 [Dreissena polymorpha]|uniref:Uncharacterized protein n=1 Tax=Dreissena polymorpha TaxID=45954 RepID=A0A9D4GUV0_DREPO|nr:hypothetical protein DPMN_122113 [Dreissena polymorpha]